MARHLRNRISSLLGRSSSLFLHEGGGGSVSTDISPLSRASSQMTSGLRSWSSLSSAPHFLERRNFAQRRFCIEGLDSKLPVGLELTMEITRFGPKAMGVRHMSTRSKRVDLGAKARQLQQRRLWGIALAGTAIAGFVIVVLNTFQENLLFYITPSQAMERFFNDPTKNRFRLGGLVLEGSVQHFKNSADMEFVVTDLANEILVRYRGALPDLFREGHSVVAEGFVKPMSQYPGIPANSSDMHTSLTVKAKDSGCYFAAIEVLAKHDEKYMPKEVAAAVAKNKAMQEAKEIPAALTTPPQGVSAPVIPALPPPSGGQKKKGVAQAPAVAQAYEIKA